jgi:predicted site-specific integrase-resolvase
MGLDRATVTGWIAAGLLRASLQRDGQYRIRHRAIRRALRDHPQVAATAMRAWQRWHEQHSRQG